MVLNFDDRQVDVQVRIPADAFVYLGQEEMCRCTMTDLLTDTVYEGMPFNTAEPVRLTLPAWKGVVLKVIKNK